MIGETDELGLRAVEDKVHMHDAHATMLSLLGLTTGSSPTSSRAASNGSRTSAGATILRAGCRPQIRTCGITATAALGFEKSKFTTVSLTVGMQVFGRDRHAGRIARGATLLVPRDGPTRHQAQK